MFIDGVSTTLSGLINMGDIIQIRYTGIRFEVLINGIVKRSIIKQASGSLYLVAQTNSYALVPLTVITDVSFTPLTGGQIRYPSTTTATAVANPPDFDRVGLLTWGTLVTGTFRERMMREPYEFLYRELQSFLFDEPITYQIVKTTNSDVVSVQLPIEANHPIEEVIWVIRRRAVADNNEWYNFGSYLERDFAYAAASGIPLEQRPLLTYARLQANGQPLIEGDERYFRRQIGQHHDGGYTAYNQYVYGYSFAKTPGDHQPSGTANASRLSSFRLTLDVAVPTVFKSPSANASTDLTWEVRVYVLALNWLRVENGLVNRIYQD